MGESTIKLAVDKVKQVPKEVTSGFGVCFYGQPSDEVKQWISAHGLDAQSAGPYVNVMINKPISDLFCSKPKFKYMDGFSPNLNKQLHIGHASNLIIAKAFMSLGIAEKTVAILGDTLQGDISKEDALKKLHGYCEAFGYKVDQFYFASDMKCDMNLSVGEGDYVGSKVFDLGDEKLVAIKSTGETTYFYQDVALAQQLNASTLYLTGHEQDNHFKSLKKLFPTINHVGLGLVEVKSGKLGGKMSSRLGNVILLEDVIKELMDEFNGDVKLAYNVLAGFILKSAPKSNKSLDMYTFKNPLDSPGLYLSYTLAKLKSAGVVCSDINEFVSLHLQFKKMKAQSSMMPSVLLDALLEHAKHISVLYVSHKIKDNEENKKMFGVLASDLLLGMKSIGMFDVEKV